MASANFVLGAVVLIAAGLYQWTPLKDMSGLLMRHGWPLAVMLYADQVPIRLAHSKMR